MRKAAVASVAIHLGLIVGAWGLLQFKPAEEIGAESVSVDIISMDVVSSEPSEMITGSNKTLISAGAETEAMEAPEVAEVEAVEADVAKPVEVAEAPSVKAVEPFATAAQAEAAEPTEELASAEVMTAVMQAIAAVEAAMPQRVDAAATAFADSVALSKLDPLEAVRTASIGELTPEPPIQDVPEALLTPAEAIEPVETASLSPIVEDESQVAPIPKPRIVRMPVEAEVEPPSKQANLGNGGAAQADTKASKKSGGGQGKKDDGGSAAASKYPGLVQAKVTRAVKRPPQAQGKGGEVRVSFTVAANGNVTNVALSLSSGDATLDKAALAAVNRAAPFPPIPAAAGRSSWSFSVPIYFNR